MAPAVNLAANMFVCVVTWQNGGWTSTGGRRQRDCHARPRSGGPSQSGNISCGCCHVTRPLTFSREWPSSTSTFATNESSTLCQKAQCLLVDISGSAVSLLKDIGVWHPWVSEAWSLEPQRNPFGSRTSWVCYRFCSVRESQGMASGTIRRR